MIYSRRNFIKGTGALVLGGMALSGKATSFLSNMEHHPVGLQLFTFFGIIDEDVKGTLSKIAAVGYKELESAFSKKGGYYGMKPKEFKVMVNDLGMSWTSHHVLALRLNCPREQKCLQVQMVSRWYCLLCLICVITCSK
ncbi:twin-arginine translocation signal domain-containing protein [Mucilaginibacter sp. UC70_90]